MNCNSVTAELPEVGLLSSDGNLFGYQPYIIEEQTKLYQRCPITLLAMAQNAGEWQNWTSNTCLPSTKKSSKYIEDTLAKKNLSEQANKRLNTG